MSTVAARQNISPRQERPTLECHLQVSGRTDISSTVTDLNYRGYRVADLAVKSNFEEVAYLLLSGRLPTQDELTAYKNSLFSLRPLPPALIAILQRIPASAHPLDVLRTGCSVLAHLEPEELHPPQYEDGPQRAVADRLLAVMPTLLCYWYRYTRDGVSIDTETDEESSAGHFLCLLHGHAPSALQQRCLDVLLLLHAEHGFNESSCNARSCAAVQADIHSALISAVSALRGVAHGGASAQVMALIEPYRTAQQAETALRQLCSEGRINCAGWLGSQPDVRSGFAKSWSRQLADGAPDGYLYTVAETVEQLLNEHTGGYVSVDFYSATAWHFLGVPRSLFASLLACARLVGWSAHIFEQRYFEQHLDERHARRQWLEPDVACIGPALRPWLSMEQRDVS